LSIRFFKKMFRKEEKAAIYFQLAISNEQ